MTKKNRLYSEKVFKHFKNPHNLGKIKDADGVGKVGNILCGDVMWIYIKMGKDKKDREIIQDVRFETFGCVAAVATSSVATDLAKGKTLKQALAINTKSIVGCLGGLPPIKVHCSALASDALSEAIYDYLFRQGREISKELELRHQRISKALEEINQRYQDHKELSKNNVKKSQK